MLQCRNLYRFALFRLIFRFVLFWLVFPDLYFPICIFRSVNYRVVIRIVVFSIFIRNIYFLILFSRPVFSDLHFQICTSPMGSFLICTFLTCVVRFDSWFPNSIFPNCIFRLIFFWFVFLQIVLFRCVFPDVVCFSPDLFLSSSIFPFCISWFVFSD